MNTLTNLKSSGMLPCNFSIPYWNGLKKLNVGVWKLGIQGTNITCTLQRFFITVFIKTVFEVKRIFQNMSDK